MIIAKRSTKISTPKKRQFGLMEVVYLVCNESIYLIQ